MKHVRIILFSALLLSGCAVAIYSDLDTYNDFGKYKTFAWYPKPSSAFKNDGFDNQIVENNIKNYASAELKLRGYSVDVDSPDVLLDYNIMVEKKVEQQQTPVYSYSHPYNYNYGGFNNGFYNNRNYNGGFYNRNVYMPPPIPYVVGYQTVDIPYEEGTLTIMAVDRKTNKLIWKGWSVGTVTDEQTYEYELHSDIHRIFKRYPVKIIKKK